MKLVRILAICFAFSFLSACAPITLKMAPNQEPVDRSVSAGELSKSKFKKIMVIPPHGTVRGEFDNVVSIFEREFLKKGITVISAAVTGRVVLESSTKDEKNSGGAVNLSDAERALVMAKESGADGILQIGAWTWEEGIPTRFFLRDISDPSYREVTRQIYANSKSNYKIAFSSGYLRFIGRLMDVTSGEVRASFEIESGANWNMPNEYTATVIESSPPSVSDENYSYANANWTEIRRATVEKVISQVVSRIGNN